MTKHITYTCMWDETTNSWSVIDASNHDVIKTGLTRTQALAMAVNQNLNQQSDVYNS